MSATLAVLLGIGILIAVAGFIAFGLAALIEDDRRYALAAVLILVWPLTVVGVVLWSIFAVFVMAWEEVRP